MGGLFHIKYYKNTEICHITSCAYPLLGTKLFRLKFPRSCSYAERWVHSVKEECLSRYILFSERSLSHVLKEYVAHYHQERPHQGKGNVVLLPSPDQDPARQGPIQCRERLGGLLKY